MGPTRALRPQDGNPVYIAKSMVVNYSTVTSCENRRAYTSFHSNHFSAISPSTVGGRPHNTCQKSCTCLYLTITYAISEQMSRRWHVTKFTFVILFWNLTGIIYKPNFWALVSIETMFLHVTLVSSTKSIFWIYLIDDQSAWYKRLFE